MITSPIKSPSKNAPEVPLQCLCLLQLDVIHPRVEHDRSCALIALQDCRYLHRNVMSVHFNFSKGSTDMPDDGVYDDHSIAFSLAEGSEVVPGGDLKGQRRRRGRGPHPGLGSRLPLLVPQGPWCPGARAKDIWEDCILGAQGLCRETHGVEVVGVLAACCILTPDLWAAARDVSSAALRSLSWACFYTRSRICFSTASSLTCT